MSISDDLMTSDDCMISEPKPKLELSNLCTHLFTDKYRPTSFQNIQFNFEIAQKMISCSKIDDIPHLIIKGPSGSGKGLFADLYVQTKYGLNKLKIKQQTLEIKHTNKTISLQLLYSNYHYKIDPSLHGVYDRLIIQGFIKDILQTKPISQAPYHIIIIENADKLTLEAQQSLRRTLEKYIDNCRFIFIIGHESTLIGPLMSRCLQLRLSAPTNLQIQTILTQICQAEKINIDDAHLTQITNYCNRNLNKAINLIQDFSTKYPKLLTNLKPIIFSDHIEIDNYIYQIVELLLAKRTPKTILLVRSKLYDLLVHCREPILILKQLFHLIFNRLNLETNNNQIAKYNLIDALIKYENTMKLGSKPIYHLEGFINAVITLLG